MVRSIAYDGYRRMPWRNGLGVTREIAREPQAGEDFAWRLSLAQIEHDCDFSAYPGYRRALVLIGGDRLRLRFQGHGGCTLSPARRGVRFEGAWHTRCAVPEGPCTDLTLIVRDAAGARSPAVLAAPKGLRVTSTRRVQFPRPDHGALFVLEGSVSVTGPQGAPPHCLDTHDTLLVAADSGGRLTVRNRGQGPARLVMLRWRASADGIASPPPMSG